MSNILTTGIDNQNRVERRRRADTRRQEDIRKGLTKTSDPQRGDYKMCREGDKLMSDYRNYKDPKDREKIKDKFFQMQREFRKPKEV